MDQTSMLKIVEQYSRQISPENGEIKVMQLPDQKTVFIEQNGETGRLVDMREYKVDGKTYWAGYSTRSQTVYVSLGR